MEGYYQYSVSIDEKDAVREYTGVIFSDNGYDSTVSRICSWYQNYGEIQSITVANLQNGAVCELPTFKGGAVTDVATDKT